MVAFARPVGLGYKSSRGVALGLEFVDSVGVLVLDRHGDRNGVGPLVHDDSVGVVDVGHNGEFSSAGVHCCLWGCHSRRLLTHSLFYFLFLNFTK